MPYYKNEKKTLPIIACVPFLKELQNFTYNNWKGVGLRKKKPFVSCHIKHALCDLQEKLVLLAPIDLPCVSQTS
jgi:hypothetical protein